MFYVEEKNKRNEDHLLSEFVEILGDEVSCTNGEPVREKAVM